MKDKKKRILFVYNPKAGKSKIRNVLADIIDIFVGAGYEVTAHSTQCQGDGLDVVANHEENMYDMVVCSGGDGTLDEVVTGMNKCREKLPIGYIPAGSTNDFAYSLDISSDMIEAAEDIVNGKVIYCDVGEFNDDAFVYIAAFGIFTEVSYATDQHMKNVLGHTAYILEGIKSLASMESYYVRFESEEQRGEGEFIYGMISNSVSVGGFKGITGNDVELDDGVFEVTLIKKPSTLAEMNNLVRALITRDMDSDCILNFKTAELKIRSLEPVSWALDGEYGGTCKVAVIKNRQRELPMIVRDEEGL